MKCVECGAQETRVVDSRDTAESIRRRRECLACSTRFTTHERVERNQIWVTKRDGRKQPFRREKILAGISLACRKRPFSDSQLESMVDRVIVRLEARREVAVPAAVVGDTVMGVLREVDDIAYVRFASVYGAFESVEQFVDTIAPLREGV